MSPATFAHELEHLGGVADEEVTQCYAVQNLDEVAAALGLARARGRRLQMLFWELLYPLLPKEYTSGDCRDGGPLDVEPLRNGWP